MRVRFGFGRTAFALGLLLGIAAGAVIPAYAVDAVSEQSALNEQNEQAEYVQQLRDAIQRNWMRPDSGSGESCTVLLRQNRKGSVDSLVREDCSDALWPSVERAVRRTEPLPQPTSPALFNTELRLSFEAGER